MVSSQILYYLGQFGYIAIIPILAFTGYLIPIPEEIILITIGYLVSVGFGSFPIALAACIIGVAAGDNIVYWLSRSGNKIAKFKERFKIIKKYDEKIQRNICAGVFCFRFVFGLRFLGPFFAGTMKLKWKKFLFYNTLAILVYVPLLFSIGYFFHNKITSFLADMYFIRHGIFIFAIILFWVVIAIILKKKYFSKAD